jgi:hypothetical protein
MKKFLIILPFISFLFFVPFCFAYQSLATYSDSFNMPHGTATVKMDDGKVLLSVIVENAGIKTLNFSTMDAYIYDDQGKLHEIDFSKQGLPEHGVLRPRSITKVEAYLPEGVNLIKEIYLEFDNGYSLHYVGMKEKIKKEQEASRIKFLFDR